MLLVSKLEIIVCNAKHSNIRKTEQSSVTEFIVGNILHCSNTNNEQYDIPTYLPFGGGQLATQL